MPLGRLTRALWIYGTGLARHERWTRARLEQYQEAELRRLLHFAHDRSPFYRQLYRGLDLDRVPLRELPVVTKRELMDNYDAVLTDRQLSKAVLQAFAATPDRKPLYRDRYLVLQTSGTTGVPGMLPYSPEALVTSLAAVFRSNRMSRMRYSIPWRTAVVMGPNPSHLSYASAVFLNGGPFQSSAVPSDRPLPEIVARLNRLQPHVLLIYPNLLGLIMREQREGRLAITPRAISISGEVPPPTLKSQVEALWPGAELREVYAFTELGVGGARCPECGAIHLYEDLGVFEVLKGDGTPAEPGATGDRFVLTNLINRTFPLIRYEMGDRLRLFAAPNRCGRPWRTLAAVEGRANDIIRLPDRNGSPVAIPPMVLVNRMVEVRGAGPYQIGLKDDGLHIAVVPEPDAPPGLAERVEHQFRSLIEELDLVPPVIHVELVQALERVGGKLKTVVQ